MKLALGGPQRLLDPGCSACSGPGLHSPPAPARITRKSPALAAPANGQTWTPMAPTSAPTWCGTWVAFLTPFGGGWEGTGASPLELVPTPSCSTGCTFHSESSRRRGLGEVRQRGGGSLASSGADPPGSSRPGRDYRPNQQGEGRQECRCPERVPSPFSSRAKALKSYLGHVPRRHRGTTWGVTLTPFPPTLPQPHGQLMGLHAKAI